MCDTEVQCSTRIHCLQVDEEEGCCEAATGEECPEPKAMSGSALMSLARGRFKDCMLHHLAPIRTRVKTNHNLDLHVNTDHGRILHAVQHLRPAAATVLLCNASLRCSVQS